MFAPHPPLQQWHPIFDTRNWGVLLLCVKLSRACLLCVAVSKLGVQAMLDNLQIYSRFLQAGYERVRAVFEGHRARSMRAMQNYG